MDLSNLMDIYISYNKQLIFKNIYQILKIELKNFTKYEKL